MNRPMEMFVVCAIKLGDFGDVYLGPWHAHGQ
jgi:hypothetical protein